MPKAPKLFFTSLKTRENARKKRKIEKGDEKWKETPKDVLFEIFIRLPDARSAIRSGAVCRNWNSVISQDPQFIPRFISRHQQHQHHYTIMFRKADNNSEFADPKSFQPICKLSSERWMLARPRSLDFLPCPMVIRGSCNDLLLVSPGPLESTHLYICNPITKQFIPLPEIPTSHHRRVTGHALVCMPSPTNKSRFKVVVLLGTVYPHADSELRVQHVMLFCSESRNWELRKFHYPRHVLPPKRINWQHVVECNGILYWLELERDENNRVIYLDLSNNQCGVIHFPNHSYGIFSDEQYAREQIGVVRVCGGEELRLLQVLLKTGKKSFVDLNVWKLVHNDQNGIKKWVLVQDYEVQMPNGRTYQTLPFFHPTNGDAVFMVWGQTVFQYDLIGSNSTAKRIGELQESLGFANSYQEPTHRLLPFPTLHSNWPTCLT